MEEIGPNELGNLVARHGGIDIVCGGFNCQSLSQAGQKKGAEDMRFGSFYHLVSMLNWCQNKQQGRKVVWVCENTWPGYGPWEERKAGAMEMIEGMLGRGALIDAGYTGSNCHRPRYYWTNIARYKELLALVPVDYPLASLNVVLEDFHTPAPVLRSHEYPF